MKNRKTSEYRITKFTTIAYGFANFADNSATQLFNFLLFTFYFAVVGLDVNIITFGFIIWSLWNAVNDPIMGAWSDRGKSSLGRRKPFIILGIVPTCILLVLLWTPPLDSELASFVYFLIIILVYDTFYTMFYVNQMALFPEMYQNLDDRAKANTILQIFTIFALIIAFISPSFFIREYENPIYFVNYRFAGLFIAIIVALSAGIFIKYGLKERFEYSKDPEIAPSFKKALSYSLKNKAFITYIIANFSTYYILGIYTTLTALYGSYVLNQSNSFLISLLLGFSFISAIIFMIFWQKVSLKLGIKSGLIVALASGIIVTIPFLFSEDFISGMITYFIAGFSLAGMLFFRRITLASVIDDDELRTGVRREGSFYGVDALIVKLSTIAIFLSISLVFNSVGWKVFDPIGTPEQTVLGLKLLMWLFPSIALAIGILSMIFFPITKNRYEEIRQKIDVLHEEKKTKTSQI